MPIPECTVRLAGRIAMTVAGCLLLLPVHIAFADGIYKSVDAQGHVIYSDRPNTAGARKTKITVQQADPDEAVRLAKERVLLRAEDDQRKKQELLDSKAKAQQDAKKKVQCKNARDHYNYLKDSRRLYTSGADGNRDYYTDAQMDAMRAEALRTMNVACAP